MTSQQHNDNTDGLTILIVDDDKTIQEELQTVLQLQGWNPITADSVADPEEFSKNRSCKGLPCAL